ncbi:MAG: aldehyde:ferredoxin oxidoreductase, partial [Deltaproteobacteria bacterium]|nr:aldehyde:ferredoxin oxidoreductase [Deltaproteobacteria bacterium]
MQGFYQRLLRLDLGSRSFAIEPLAPEILRRFPGGKGLATWLLYRHNPVGVDPLSPANLLVFATGPATGSRIWGSCRYGVFSKSPQTGIYSESYAGGRVPEAIDACGFDAIIIGGAAAEPLVLRVHPEGVDFLPAADLWGLDTYATEGRLRARCADDAPGRRQGAVVIGPAGENLVRFAVIENDYWRSAGRTGLGAVMGAKKLKGIFFSGDRRRPLADPEGTAAWSKKLARENRDQAGVLAYKKMGTPMMVKIMNQAGAFPSRYWSRGTDDQWPQISAEALHRQCDVKPHACRQCFMACGRLTTVRHGRHAGLRLEGPEYETIYAFGGLCGIHSIEEIAWLNDLCDRLGMDTISAGNLCAFTIEASRRGRADCRLDYGDVDGIAALLRGMAAREGVGALLAEGIRAAARQWQLEDLAIHVKGLEPAGYDPRVLKGMGLAYATSDRGACHLRTTFYKAELSGMIDPEQTAGKA